MRHVPTILLGSTLLCVLAATPVGAASHQLSLGEAFSDVGMAGAVPVDDIRLPAVSPDGRWAIYLQDAETDGAFELWRAPLDGGAPSRLSGLLLPGQEVRGYRFTPDGETVLYNAYQDAIDRLDLYAAPLTGAPGSHVRLNDPLAANRMAKVIGVSPDSTQVVYGVCDPLASHNCFEFWIADVAGNNATLLYDPPAGHAVYDLELSPDFDYAVFQKENQTGGNLIEVWSLALAGGDPVKLNGLLATDGDVGPFVISHEGDRVAYLADQQTNDKVEVYVVPIGGGAATKVSPPLAADEDAESLSFAEGGARVVFTVRDGAGEGNIWSAAIDGNNEIQLNPAVVTGGTVQGGLPILGGSRVIYVADQDVVGRVELYSVPTGGGASVKLNTPLAASREIDAVSFSDDQSRLYYVADHAADERDELWSVSTLGGAVTRVSHRRTEVGSDWDVVAHRPALGTSGAAYFYRSKGCDACVAMTHLYIASPAGGDENRLDNCLGAFENVIGEPVPSPVHARRVVYVADQVTNARYDLYLGDPCVLCDGFESGGFVRWTSTSP